MAGFGRYILSADLKSFLSRRSCLLKLSQNVRQKATKKLEEVELPPKPKKPQPTFLMYLTSIRPKLIEENPDITVTEIVQRASKDWNTMDLAVKEGLKTQYNKSYEQYLQNLKDYKESLTDKQKEFLEQQKKISKEKAAMANVKQKSDLFQKPKRPLNAFLLFVNSKRKTEQPRDKHKEWLCNTTRLWKNLPSDQKEHYIDEATKLMVNYKLELSKWEENMVNLGHPDVVRRTRLPKTKVQES